MNTNTLSPAHRFANVPGVIYPSQKTELTAIPRGYVRADRAAAILGTHRNNLPRYHDRVSHKRVRVPGWTRSLLYYHAATLYRLRNQKAR